MLKSVMVAVALTFSVAACSSERLVTTPIGDVATKPIDITEAHKAAYAAKAAYAGLLTVAVAYNNRPRCGAPTSPPLCSDAAVVAQLRKASAAADAATQAAEDAVRTMGQKPAIFSAAVVTAQNSVKAFSAITEAYAK